MFTEWLKHLFECDGGRGEKDAVHLIVIVQGSRINTDVTLDEETKVKLEGSIF